MQVSPHGYTLRQQSQRKNEGSTHPQARSEGIVAEQVGDEFVVYVEDTQTAQALSPAASSVWRLCDGTKSPVEMARTLGLDKARIAETLEQLEAACLLEQPHLITRRQAHKRLAQAGAAALAAPLIYSVAIPNASAAAPLCSSKCGCDVQIDCSLCSASEGEKGTSSACMSGDCYRTHTGVGLCICIYTDCVTYNNRCEIVGSEDNCCDPGTCFGSGSSARCSL